MKRGLIGLHEGSCNLGKDAWTLYNEELRGEWRTKILEETHTHSGSNLIASQHLFSICKVDICVIIVLFYYVSWDHKKNVEKYDKFKNKGHKWENIFHFTANEKENQEREHIRVHKGMRLKVYRIVPGH